MVRSESGLSSSELFGHFPRYTYLDPLVPTYRLSSSLKPTIHRFFDTSPISPSGKFIALFELPFDDRMPVPGEEGSVVVVELETAKVIYRTNTAAWDTQLGSQVQWGKDDNELFFNRMNMRTLTPFGVKVNVADETESELPLTVYMASKCGRFLVTPCLKRIARVQAGYGVRLPSNAIAENRGAVDDDGLYFLDLASGRAELLLSFSRIVEALPHMLEGIPLNAGGFYGFHTKICDDCRRLMFVVRWIPDDGSKNKSYLVTCDRDGGQIHLAVDSKCWEGGHHPNWCPDNETIVMNLKQHTASNALSKIKSRLEKLSRKVATKTSIDLRYFSDESPLRFKRFRFDGSDCRILGSDVIGSGHPSIHPSGRYLLADAYLRERFAGLAGDVPIRLLDLQSSDVVDAIRVETKPKYRGPLNAFRIDPHPVWDRSGRYVTFNGKWNGMRTVFAADFNTLLGTHQASNGF